LSYCRTVHRFCCCQSISMQCPVVGGTCGKLSKYRQCYINIHGYAYYADYLHVVWLALKLMNKSCASSHYRSHMVAVFGWLFGTATHIKWYVTARCVQVHMCTCVARFCAEERSEEGKRRGEDFVGRPHRTRGFFCFLCPSMPRSLRPSLCVSLCPLLLYIQRLLICSVVD